VASEPPTRPLEPRPDPYRNVPVGTQAELVEELRRSKARATAGLVLAILALVAGAVAVVLALDDDSSGGTSDRRGVSRSSFSDLREDVRSLEDDVNEIRDQSQQGSDVDQKLEDIDERLQQVSDRQGQTSDQIQELQDRVDALESEPTPEPTETPQP
jgi:TolA-binding protein